MNETTKREKDRERHRERESSERDENESYNNYIESGKDISSVGCKNEARK